ncbi:UDP-N-acetylglucosamine 2-epimerase (non-hydrolyzing) [bacterium]|mgnify:CR=1 FL=1|jgi:UDP-N-acetylglucosamine 2-epimerase (non-hydrolysing)|nr:UDP-N-acetylglucosamine 2-epimerase (non-hydrolyzing) [bacterium]
MKIAVIIGTRPEAIKCAPVVHAIQSEWPEADCRVITTGQHKAILDQSLAYFGIKPDLNLGLMKPNQTLSSLTAGAVEGLDAHFKEEDYDVVLVQGDTTTAFSGALAAFYNKIPVGHIEAGLRSSDMMAPYPEEGNRRLISVLGTAHFTPTEKSSQNLKSEGVKRGIHEVGNTVIDALLWTSKKIKGESDRYNQTFSYLDNKKPLILVTAHRRENFGEGINQICQALRTIVEETGAEIIYPVHPNPNIKGPVTEALSEVAGIHLVDPVDYDELVYLMNRCHIIITDSGGIQEEGPSLNKPILVLRDVTERPEGIDVGAAKLVGTDTATIVAEAKRLITNQTAYQAMANIPNPYGDGLASFRIVEALRKMDPSK